MRIKYFEGATKLEVNPKGNLIDVYAREDVFIPYMGYAMIKLGFALSLPKGCIAKLYPRSSTFKTWGCILTNSVGIIDETYSGDDDEWLVGLQCTMPKQTIKTMIEGHQVTISGTWIKKGDKIAQFEIVKATHPLMYNFEEVEHLDGPNRGGFGSTGKR